MASDLAGHSGWTANYLINGEPVYVVGRFETGQKARRALRTFLTGPGRTDAPVWWAWVEVNGIKFYWEGERWVIG